MNGRYGVQPLGLAPQLQLGAFFGTGSAVADGLFRLSLGKCVAEHRQAPL
jgi:hypothetical protein